MQIILSIFATITFISGLYISVGATTVFQEIEGSIWFLIAAVFFSGGAIVEAVDRLGKKPVQEAKSPMSGVPNLFDRFLGLGREKNYW